MFTDRAAHALIGIAAVWDLAGITVAPPAWWPVPSYWAVALGIAASCLGVLLHLFGTRAAGRARARTALRLLLTGLLVLAWLLRAHPEIAPDLPVIATQVVIALALFLARHR